MNTTAPDSMECRGAVLFEAGSRVIARAATCVSWPWAAAAAVAASAGPCGCRPPPPISTRAVELHHTRKLCVATQTAHRLRITRRHSTEKGQPRIRSRTRLVNR